MEIYKLNSVHWKGELEGVIESVFIQCVSILFLFLTINSFINCENF